MTFKNEEYKKWESKNQFFIPKRLQYIAHSFGRELTYNEVTDFYTIAVQEVLIFYNVKLLSEVPWGVGFKEVSDRWVEKMTTCLKRRNSKKEG